MKHEQRDLQRNEDINDYARCALSVYTHTSKIDARKKREMN